MRFIKKQINFLQLFIFCVLITSFTQTSQAKSVYAIINHQSDIIGAYKIEGNQITFQDQMQAPQHGYRAIDLAIDSDSCCIFVTYEYSNIIEMVHTSDNISKKCLTNIKKCDSMSLNKSRSITMQEEINIELRKSFVLAVAEPIRKLNQLF